MKKILAVSLFVCACLLNSRAALLFSDDFNSYTNGALVGQGNWAQTGSSATSPVQVSSGLVNLGTSGQDVYSPFSSVYSTPVGSTLYIGLDLSVASAQAAGDYFLHTTPTVGNSSIFVDRVFIKSSGSGFVLGYSAGANAATYGTTVLSLSTDYRVVLAYNNVAGATNDTASIYVNPTDSSTESNNSAYLSDVPWGSTTAETNSVATINFRQGTASSAPAESVDNLDVGTQFSDVSLSSVPEPSTFALLGTGCAVALSFLIRRKK